MRVPPLPGDEWDERMDLIFAVGCYALLATAVNSLGIEEEHQPHHVR